MLVIINKVRVYKKLFLPFELVDVDRGITTNYYWNVEEQSSVLWNMCDNDQKEEVPTKAEYRVWNAYIKWLRDQTIVTIYNFCKSIT